jgi:hypothetical protein
MFVACNLWSHRLSFSVSAQLLLGRDLRAIMHILIEIHERIGIVPKYFVRLLVY